MHVMIIAQHSITILNMFLYIPIVIWQTVSLRRVYGRSSYISTFSASIYQQRLSAFERFYHQRTNRPYPKDLL